MYHILYSRRWPLVSRLVVMVTVILFVSTVFSVSSYISYNVDLYVRIAAAFVLVEAAILVLLSLCLIQGKLGMVRRRRLRQERLDALRDLVAQYAGGGQTEPPLLAAAQEWPLEFLDVVEDSLCALKGSARERVEHLLKKSEAFPALLDQADDRSPHRALKAISLLRRVNDLRCETAILGALSHPEALVQMAARIAVLRGDNKEAQWEILQDIPTLPFWQRLVLFHQVPSDSDILPRFLGRCFQSGQEELKLAALEFILSRQRFFPARDHHRLGSSPNLEIRIKYFKALPWLADGTETSSILRVGLSDPDWRVRAMAARACGQLQSTELAPVLLEVLKSALVPAEASHAARALAAFGGEARRELETLSSGGSEMAHRVISEAIEKEALLGVST